MNTSPSLLSLNFWCVALLGLSNNLFAECIEDITGKWQLARVEIQGHKVNDNTQTWEFMTDGTVRFVKTRPPIDVTAEYACDGDIIYMKGRIPDRLKILSFDGSTMAWESLEHGGVFHVEKLN